MCFFIVVGAPWIIYGIYIVNNVEIYGGCPIGYHRDELIEWHNLVRVLITIGFPVGQWWKLEQPELRLFHFLSIFILGIGGMLVMPIFCCLQLHDDYKRRRRANRMYDKIKKARFKKSLFKHDQ